MRVSVVGCGTISETHLKVLSGMAEIEISSVVDTDKEKADKTAEKHNCKAFYDFDTMLDEDMPECVHILTPHYLHAPMAVKALNKGINVFCEKPCAMNTQELLMLKKAQMSSKAMYGVCFQNRYNETVKEALKRIKSEAYGKMKGITGQVFWVRDEDYYSDAWHGKKSKEGGGVLINQAIHTEDLMDYLVGSDIKTVCAHVSNDHLKGVIDVEDTAILHLEYENGVKGILCATTAFCVNKETVIEMIFENGKMKIEGSYLYEILPDSTQNIIAENKNSQFFGKSYWGNAHGFIIKDFYDHLKRGEHFPVDAFEGGKVTAEIDSAYYSDRKGEPIRLN